MAKPTPLWRVRQFAKASSCTWIGPVFVNQKVDTGFKCDLCSKNFEATLSNLKRQNGCETCSRKAGQVANKWTVQELQAYAKDRGGKLLSTTYVDAKGTLEWECGCGNVWLANWNNVFHGGNWCPQHSKYLNERLTRVVLEAIFKCKLPTAYPEWLKSSGAKGINPRQLDGYCPEKSLAFEYHGLQHFKDVPFFNKTDSLAQRRARDRLKALQCKKLGIQLIIVNGLEGEGDPKKIIEIVSSASVHCRGYREINPNEVDWKSAYSPTQTELMDEMSAKARENGGELLSLVFRGLDHEYEWRCGDCRRVWGTSGRMVLNGHWCKPCRLLKAGARRRLKSFKGTVEMVARHFETKVRLLSTFEDYTDSSAWLRFECIANHEHDPFVASRDTIKGSIRKKMPSLCPDCGDERVAALYKRPEEELLRKVKKLGFKFHGWENEYCNGDSIMKLECPRHGKFPKAAKYFWLAKNGGCHDCRYLRAFP